jgi:hypothetical protein
LGIVEAAGIARVLGGFHQHFVPIPSGDLDISIKVLNQNPPVRS